MFWGVYRKLEEPGLWAKSVYSKIQGPGRFLVPSVYKILEKTGPRAKSVYAKIQGPGRFLVQGVYLCAQKVEARAIQASYLSEYTG